LATREDADIVGRSRRPALASSCVLFLLHLNCKLLACLLDTNPAWEPHTPSFLVRGAAGPKPQLTPGPAMADLDLPFGHANLLFPLLFPRSGCGCVCAALRCSSRSSSAFSACVWAPPRALLFLSLPVLVACGLCRARAGLRSGSVMHLIIGCLHSKSSYICCPSPLSSGSHRRAFCQELALQLLSASRPGTGHRPRWRWTSPACSDPGSISVCFWYAASDIPVTTLKKEKHAVCLAEMLGRVPPPPPPPPHPPRGDVPVSRFHLSENWEWPDSLQHHEEPLHAVHRHGGPPCMLAGAVSSVARFDWVRGLD